MADLCEVTDILGSAMFMTMLRGRSSMRENVGGRGGRDSRRSTGLPGESCDG